MKDFCLCTYVFKDAFSSKQLALTFAMITMLTRGSLGITDLFIINPNFLTTFSFIDVSEVQEILKSRYEIEKLTLVGICPFLV